MQESKLHEAVPGGPSRRGNEQIPAMDKNLRIYLRREISKITHENPDVIVEKIEEMSKMEVPNPREALMLTFSPIFAENTGLFVSRLLGYAKRPCRDGPQCRRPGCYFSHAAPGELGAAGTPAEAEQMEIDDEYGGEKSRGPGSQLSVLFDRQKRLFEILGKKPDIPPDVLLVIDRLRRTAQQIKLLSSKRGTTPESRSARFIITNRKEWMTKEHLSTYPGVVDVTSDGVVECETRRDAERAMNMIIRGDYTSKPEWR